MMAFRRYGGSVETNYSGLERFVEVRGIAIALGLPAAAFSGIVTPVVGAFTLASVVAYFFLGFLGELKVKYGFYAVCVIATVTILGSLAFDQLPYLASGIILVFHLFVLWNAYVLHRKNR